MKCLCQWTKGGEQRQDMLFLWLFTCKYVRVCISAHACYVVTVKSCDFWRSSMHAAKKSLHYVLNTLWLCIYSVMSIHTLKAHLLKSVETTHPLPTAVVALMELIRRRLAMFLSACTVCWSGLW